MLRDMLCRAAKLAGRICYVRYLMASAVALGADLAVFLLLLHVKVHAVPASVAGYLVGLGVHWLLSSYLVFVQHAALKSSEQARGKRKMLFIASAVAGLAITIAMMAQGIRWGIDPGPAKLIAVVVSFQTTYLLRRTFVFS